jgi:sec-independent protein translocase protein TatA
VVFVLFGGKFKISDVMGDVAKGIKAFKKGLAEEEIAGDKPVEPRAIDDKSADSNKV